MLGSRILLAAFHMVEKMPSTAEKLLVFVSHASEDAWVARQIARELKMRGAEPFLAEEDSDVGAEFEESIRGFLEKADELLVLLTPWALKRTWVWTEIGAAWIRRIPIVVVLHGISAAEFESLPNTPVFLKKRNLIGLNDLEQYFGQLERRIAGRTERE
jgi:hypothetical protein